MSWEQLPSTGDPQPQISTAADSDSFSEPPAFCSFAITGETAHFQAIFVCRTCFTGQECVCQACADECHASHNVEYIGMGPCYCDCQTTSIGSCSEDCRCLLLAPSLQKAAELGHVRQSQRQTSSCDTMDEKPVNQHDVFRVPLLEDNTEAANVLVNQCKALVAESRDTFWLDQATCDTAPVLCCLEQLAWSIFQQHIRRYGMDESNAMGCEYWVQCKNVSFPGNDCPNLENYCNGEEAVDLHYDKDEVVAEYFGLGMFPTLSTVTYLAGSVDAPPTMVLDHTYNDPDEKDISSILVSRPQVGKHLVFDGRLLHGAPSHFALRNLTQRSSSERLTFLVNVWVGHKPVGVRVLPNDMRSAINSATIDNSGEREKLPSILSGMEWSC